jgi:hypothetical protein
MVVGFTSFEVIFSLALSARLVRVFAGMLVSKSFSPHRRARMPQVEPQTRTLALPFTPRDRLKSAG